MAGCKPSAPAGTGQVTPPNNGSVSRQPTTRDLEAFVQSLLPSTVKVSEIKMDTPVPLPDATPGSNAWLLSVKITLTPLEDLFALPMAEDTAPLNQAVAELNRLVDWRNTYVQTPFAKACGVLEIKVPASPVPQLLVVTQPKNQPLAPSYGKLSAEWQVDRWRFAPVDMAAPKFGDLRSYFQGATMVKGSPEAEKTLRGLHDTIAQARKDIATIQGRYTEQVTSATKPGTLYTGTVNYGPNVAPCELRFLDPPPGGDARFANFQVTLPAQNPPCWYIYKARVSTTLPLPVPGAQPTPASNSFTFDWDTSKQVPKHNVFQNLVHCSNNKVGRETLANWLGNNDHGGQGLLVLDGRIDGLINDFGSTGIQLSAQQQPQTTNP